MTDLAKRLSVPLNTLHREARRLVDAGLLRSRNVGRTRLLSANLDHPATGPLTQLLDITFGSRIVIEQEFAAVPGAHAVYIFGSWAERYSGTPGAPPNDLDVLVIGSVDRTDVYEAADRAQERLGIQVNPTVRRLDQWLHAEDDRLLSQIQSSAHLLVAGEAA